MQFRICFYIYFFPVTVSVCQLYASQLHRHVSPSYMSCVTPISVICVSTSQSRATCLFNGQRSPTVRYKAAFSDRAFYEKDGLVYCPCRTPLESFCHPRAMSLRSPEHLLLLFTISFFLSPYQLLLYVYYRRLFLPLPMLTRTYHQPITPPRSPRCAALA